MAIGPTNPWRKSRAKALSYYYDNY